MNAKLNAFFRTQTRPARLATIANAVNASQPQVLAALLARRKVGINKSYGSGTPYMLYWA